LPEPLQVEVLAVVQTAREIISDMEKNPKDVAAGRRFVTHYLESTRTVVDSYWHVKQRSSKNLQELEGTLKPLLVKVRESFQKQRENLLEDDLLRLRTEMEVLQKTLELEG